jgi:hypothetical protein
MRQVRSVRYAPVQPGDQPSATRWNALEERLRAAEVDAGGDIGIAYTRAGVVLVPSFPDRLWVRITAVGSGAQVGFYGWQQILGDAGGAWVDGPASGTLADDPLMEANLSNTLSVGDRVEAERESGSNEMRAQAERCP